MSDHHLSNITKLKKTKPKKKNIKPHECSSAGLGDKDISDIVKANHILFIVFNYIR
jgi:hypothetical protein